MESLIKRSYRVVEKLFKRLLFVFLRRVLNNQPLQPKLQPEQMRRVLLLRYDMIGDMVVTLPTFRYLKILNPDMELDVLASPQNEAIISHDPVVHHAYVLQGSLWQRWKLLRTLRRRNYDVVFLCVLNRATNSGMLANYIGGRRAKKITTWRMEKYAHFFNLQSRLGAQQDSAWDKLLFMVHDAVDTSLHPHAAEPYLFIPVDSQRKAEQALASMNIAKGGYILFNLSCRNRRNEWREDGYAALIHHIRSTSAYKVLIIAMPKEQEMAQRLCSLADGVSLYPATRDILEIGEVVKNARLIVSPDTGIIHIASAVQTPTMGFYIGGKQAHKEWAPYRQKHYRVLQSQNAAYVETISNEQALQEFDSLLQEIDFPPSHIA